MSKESSANSLDTLLKTAPAIMDYLKINPQDLVPKQFQTLFELSDLNQKASAVADGFAKSLESGIGTWTKSFLTNITPLEKEDKTKATGIFNETLLKSVNQITDNLYKDIKSGKGLLFNSMLSDNVVSAMESILSFKKQVDSKFPGLSDFILSAAKMAITGIVCAYAPAAGIILKTTGILDKATDFLKTENLEKTVSNLKDGINEIKKDKELAKLQAIGTEISNISEQTHIPSDKLQKIGLNLDTLKMIGSELIKTPSAQEFIEKAGSYAAETFPYSKEDIEESLQQIKDTLGTTLKDSNLPPEMIEIIEAEVEKRFAKANEIMETCLDSKTSFFDKLAAQQDTARMIIGSVDDVKKLVTQMPEKDKIVADIFSIVQKTVKEEITGGGISALQDSLKKLPLPVAKSLKEGLGSNFANEVAIKRGEEKTAVISK